MIIGINGVFTKAARCSPFCSSPIWRRQICDAIYLIMAKAFVVFFPLGWFLSFQFRCALFKMQPLSVDSLLAAPFCSPVYLASFLSLLIFNNTTLLSKLFAVCLLWTIPLWTCDPCSSSLISSYIWFVEISSFWWRFSYETRKHFDEF